MSVTIEVNGTPRQVPDGHPLPALLDDLKLPADGVAVAVDRRVVPRGEWARVALRQGQQVEIIRAVGGG